MKSELYPATTFARRQHRFLPDALLLPLLLLLLAADASAQAPAADTTETLVIKSQVLGEDRTVLVRTPANYARGGGERFPVLYMTDGDAHIQHTSATLSWLARHGRIPEMIVVGITNTDRTRDLSPTHVAQAPDNPNARFPTSGGADKFLKFIETELIPHVESKYRTQPFRVLAGHSLGGLFAVHTMFSRPELFNSYIAVSPALHWDNFVLIERSKEFFKGTKGKNRTLFVTLGNEPGDIGDAYNLFNDVLKKQQVAGFSWEAVRMDDEDHGSVVLRSHYAGLRNAFQGWQYPRDPNTGAITGGLKGVEDHYRKLSERLGYSIQVPEGLMNQVGYQLLFQNNVEEAIAAFKLNVERYPGSANVYDSLGEAYERSGKPELALPNYEKAYTTAQRTNDPNLRVFKTNFDRMAAQAKQGTGDAKK